MNEPCRVAFLVAAVAGASPSSACAQETAGNGNSTARGEYVQVTLHAADERMLPGAVNAADRAWPIVAALFGRPKAKPKTPLQVHLYGTSEEYAKAEQRLTQGKFARNQAMFHHQSRSTHVALQPPCSEEALRAFGLPGQTVILLAWEATHAARAELCPNFSTQPHWFVDGLAAWVASQVVAGPVVAGPVIAGPVSAGNKGGKDHRSSNADTIPFFATHAARVQALQRARKLPPISAILADRIDELDLRDRYAVRAMFFRFLASTPEAAAKAAQAVRRTGGGPDHGKQVAPAVTKALGSRSQAAFERFVTDARPVWSETYRSLWMKGTAWRQAAFAETNALAWRCDPVRGGSIAATGGLQILPGGKQQMNFLFARSDGGFYSVAFVADGGFTVFDYHSRTNEWQRLGAGNAPQLRLGVRSQFAVEAAGKQLKIRIDNHSWDINLPRPLPDEISWGVGVQAGSAGTWYDVAVGPRKKK